MTVRSEIAIFATTDGSLKLLAPAGTALREGQASVNLPAGYTGDTFVWSAATRMMVEDLAKVKAVLIAAVKLTNEGYVRGLYTTTFGKQKKYSRKQQEVMDFRALAPVTTSLSTLLTASLSTVMPAFAALSAAAQKKKFRFAMAEAALRGVSVDVVIGEFEQTIESIEGKVASYEAIEQATVRAIKAAVTPAAARAAAAAANWSWTAA